MSNANKYVWFDLNTSNVDESLDFYTSVIPWGTEEWEGESDMPYTMWTAQGTPLGGAAAMPEEAQEAGLPPFWLGYVGVENLDGSLEQLQQLGGGIIDGPIDMGETGRMCVVEDPQGAVFALHQANETSEQMEPPAKNSPGAVSWCEVTVDDVDEAWEFYQTMFGWKEGPRMDAQPGVPYQIFEWDGEQMGGVSAKPEGHDVPNHWTFYFTVEDIESACERVTDGGGEVFNGPMEVPNGDQIAHCRDPFGGMFALQMPAE